MVSEVHIQWHLQKAHQPSINVSYVVRAGARKTWIGTRCARRSWRSWRMTNTRTPTSKTHEIFMRYLNQFESHDYNHRLRTKILRIFDVWRCLTMFVGCQNCETYDGRLWLGEGLVLWRCHTWPFAVALGLALGRHFLRPDQDRWARPSESSVQTIKIHQGQSSKREMSWRCLGDVLEIRGAEGGWHWEIHVDSDRHRSARSNGATMRFEPEVSWGANAGLKLAQQMLEPVTRQDKSACPGGELVDAVSFKLIVPECSWMFLNSEVKKKFPAVSYSDLWIYAACVAIEEMGGEKATLAAICLEKFEQMLMVRKVRWGLPDAQTCDQWNPKVSVFFWYFCDIFMYFAGSPGGSRYFTVRYVRCSQVPFAPGRKDKSSGSECPAWDGPTCKESEKSWSWRVDSCWCLPFPDSSQIHPGFIPTHVGHSQTTWITWKIQLLSWNSKHQPHEDGRLPSADMGSPDKTASHLRLIFNSDLEIGKARQMEFCPV